MGDEVMGMWESARIGDCVTDITSGFACAKKHAVSEGLPHLRPFNVGLDGKLDLSEMIHIPEDFKAGVERYYPEAGDVLFNNTNSVELVGKSAIVHEPMRCAFSNHMTRLRVDRARLLPEWLVLSLRQLWADGFFAARCRKWIGQAGFNTGMLADVEISLPPLGEQRRIVARVEELFARIEEARGLRVRAEEEAETLLNSELASIFSRLVEQNGTHKLGDLIVDARYGTSVKCSYHRRAGSVPVLRIPNVGSGRVGFGDMKYGVLSKARLKRILVEEGDILVVRTCGSADLVGRCAVVPSVAEPTAFASYLIRLRCDSKIISPTYLQFMLEHLREDGQLFDLARTSAGQYNVSATRLRAAQIPIPPLTEQRRIVEYLDGVQGQVMELKCLQAESAAELERLSGAILARAFRGEL